MGNITPCSQGPWFSRVETSLHFGCQQLNGFSLSWHGTRVSCSHLRQPMVVLPGWRCAPGCDQMYTGCAPGVPQAVIRL